MTGLFLFFFKMEFAKITSTVMRINFIFKEVLIMKILKEGRAHKKYAWFHTCDCCESELRIIEGDPLAGGTCYNCDESQYYIRYICPVCGHHNIAHTKSSFGIEANARYEEIVLLEEDRKEIDNWGKQMDVVGNSEDLLFLHNRTKI